MRTGSFSIGACDMDGLESLMGMTKVTIKRQRVA
jgi:hypothetical protein